MVVDDAEKYRKKFKFILIETPPPNTYKHLKELYLNYLIVADKNYY